MNVDVEVAAEKPRLNYTQWIAQQQPQPTAAPRTVAWVLQRYLEEMQDEQPLGRSSEYRNKALQRMPIGAKVAASLTKSDVIEFCRWRRKQTWKGTLISAVTVNHDLCVIAVAFAYAGAAWPECDGLSARPFTDAKPLLSKQRLISASRPRKRRPTAEELSDLAAFFAERALHPLVLVDVVLAMRWQIASLRRISETCRLEWLDWDVEKRITLVRNMKDPRTRDKHKWCALTEEAEAILFELAHAINDAGPEAWHDPERRIFAWNHRTVISAFVEAKKKLGIKGLHLHDLRAEGITRLKERGYSRDQIALVSGHEPGSDQIDVTYTRMRPEDFHRLPPAGVPAH